VVIRKTIGATPCGGVVEYLHRDSESRRRRRKGKSQIWDSKIWSRVQRDSDPRKTALARASSIYKRQTRLLVREGAPQKQDRNCQTVINILSWAPDGARYQDLLTDWLTVNRNVILTWSSYLRAGSSVQLYKGGREERALQLRVVSPAVKRRLYVCCSCSETAMITVLKSVARIRLDKTQKTSRVIMICKVWR
jgi:hypothetical protein